MWFLAPFCYSGDEPNPSMPKYVIERDIPSVGNFTTAQLSEASRTSCSVLHKLAPRVQWIQSYVTQDRMYCIYIAANPEAVARARPSRRLPGQNRISEVKAMIDSATGGELSLASL